MTPLERDDGERWDTLLFCFGLLFSKHPPQRPVGLGSGVGSGAGLESEVGSGSGMALEGSEDEVLVSEEALFSEEALESGVVLKS